MYNIFTIHPNREGRTQRKIIINNTRNDAFVVYQLLFCHQLTKYKIQKYRFEKFVTYGEFFNHNENIVIKVGNRIKIRAPQRMVMTSRFPQFSFQRKNRFEFFVFRKFSGIFLVIFFCREFFSLGLLASTGFVTVFRAFFR